MTTVPYEVLIRLKGEQAFACVRSLTVVDGHEFELPAVDLALAGPEFAAWKTQFNATVLAQRDALANEVTTLQTQLQAKQDQLSQATASLAVMTADRDAIAAELDALKNPPVNVRKIPVYWFLERLTPQEQVAITQSADVQVQIIEKRLLARSTVDLDAQRTRDGLAYFVSVGLLTPQRVTALLRDATPEELEAD